MTDPFWGGFVFYLRPDQKIVLIQGLDCNILGRAAHRQHLLFLAVKHGYLPQRSSLAGDLDLMQRQ